MIHAFFGLGAAITAGSQAVADTGAALHVAFGTL